MTYLFREDLCQSQQSSTAKTLGSYGQFTTETIDHSKPIALPICWPEQTAPWGKVGKHCQDTAYLLNLHLANLGGEGALLPVSVRHSGCSLKKTGSTAATHRY